MHTRSLGEYSLSSQRSFLSSWPQRRVCRSLPRLPGAQGWREPAALPGRDGPAEPGQHVLHERHPAVSLQHLAAGGVLPLRKVHHGSSKVRPRVFPAARPLPPLPQGDAGQGTSGTPAQVGRGFSAQIPVWGEGSGRVGREGNEAWFWVRGALSLESSQKRPSLLPRDCSKVATAFAYVMTDMWLGDSDCVSPEIFRSALGNLYPAFMKKTQQDAQEFLIYVLNELHESLKKVSRMNGLDIGGTFCSIRNFHFSFLRLFSQYCCSVLSCWRGRGSRLAFGCVCASLAEPVISVTGKRSGPSFQASLQCCGRGTPAWCSGNAHLVFPGIKPYSVPFANYLRMDYFLKVKITFFNKKYDSS